MPIYEYACKSCGERLEVSQSFSDDPLTTCTVCGGPLRKVFGSIAISFKGSGFYRTDARPGAAKAERAERDGKAEKAERDGKRETAEKGEKGKGESAPAKSDKSDKSDKASSGDGSSGSSSSSDGAKPAKVTSA